MKFLLVQALENIRASRLRSFLAVLGILVGTASVVALTSSAEMATAKALAQFRTLGTDLLAVSVYNNHSSSDNPEQELSFAATSTLVDKIPAITRIAPYTRLYLPIRYQTQPFSAQIIGTTEDLAHILKFSLQHGHFVSYYHQQQRYCVLGHNIATRTHYPLPDLIGKQIWLGQHIYTIIGVLKPKREQTFFNANIDKTVFIPLQNSRYLDSHASIQQLIVQLKPHQALAPIKARLERLIQKQIPDSKLYIRSPAQIIASMKAQAAIFRWLLGLIGGISLVVGGIGIMNIMLVSVTERRREIGLLKAIGATPRDIIYLFLTEAILLALLGGTLGVITGVGVANCIAHFAHWEMAIYLLPMLIGFGVSFFTGIFFGWYPAYRASQLNPIDALRYG